MKNIKHDLLNIPVFVTDLYIPSYNNFEHKNWRISQMELGFDHGFDHGYISGYNLYKISGASS